MEKIPFSFERSIQLANKAKALIPGGAHTYSKGDDQFPSNAPKIIDRGLGCHVWDVDGNRFQDMAMSLGSVVLGHAYEPVLEAVRNELLKGVNFLRPSRIEGELAEIIHEIIPCAEMVKFAKNGSDATTAAVKLARAYTGRKYIARCAEQPFFSTNDWFIGSTVVNRGVPTEVQELTLQFSYNDLPGVEALFNKYRGEIAGLILEPISLHAPDPGYLQALKDVCEKNGSVLIFDEVVSGFRFHLGGVQAMAGVVPHLASFGKALGNGFSCSFVAGKRELMKLGGIDGTQERVFLLSTTHGGETHCLAAAKAVIDEIQKHNIIDHFWWAGEYLQQGIKRISEETGTESFVSISGYGCKPSFAFRDETGDISAVARTLFLQESIARGLLMPYVVPSWAHKAQHLDFAIEVVGDALVKMKEAAESGGMRSAIEGECVKPVFRKYN